MITGPRSHVETLARSCCDATVGSCLGLFGTRPNNATQPATVLRAGVAQTSGEEAVGHATLVEGRYAAMARVAAHRLRELVAEVNPSSAWSRAAIHTGADPTLQVANRGNKKPKPPAVSFF